MLLRGAAARVGCGRARAQPESGACSTSASYVACWRHAPRAPAAQCPVRRQQRSVAARSNPEEMYEALFNSPVFRSEQVQQEFGRLIKEVTQLSQMAAKFPNFDLDGKKMYLDKMGEMSERYEIFIKRLELSQDPAAREYLRSMNAQMLEGGFTMNQMFMGLKQSLAEYRRWVEEEERVSGDPVAHQQFLQYFREMWGTSILGRADLSYLVRQTDPAIILKAQRDPRFWVMLREVTTSPSPDVMAKWLDDPAIGPLVAELWKSMQGKGL